MYFGTVAYTMSDQRLLIATQDASGYIARTITHSSCKSIISRPRCGCSNACRQISAEMTRTHTHAHAQRVMGRERQKDEL